MRAAEDRVIEERSFLVHELAAPTPENAEQHVSHVGKSANGSRQA